MQGDWGHKLGPEIPILEYSIFLMILSDIYSLPGSASLFQSALILGGFTLHTTTNFTTFRTKHSFFNALS